MPAAIANPALMIFPKRWLRLKPLWRVRRRIKLPMLLKQPIRHPRNWQRAPVNQPANKNYRNVRNKSRKHWKLLQKEIPGRLWQPSKKCRRTVRLISPRRCRTLRKSIVINWQMPAVRPNKHQAAPNKRRKQMKPGIPNRPHSRISKLPNTWSKLRMPSIKLRKTLRSKPSRLPNKS